LLEIGRVLLGVPAVEVTGAYEGIKFAVMKLQATELWVEGDSSAVVAK